MAKVGNQRAYTVGELIQELEECYDKDCIVTIIGLDSHGKFFRRAFYKIEKIADEPEISLYAGKDLD